MSKLLTTHELADLFGVSPTTVRRWYLYRGIRCRRNGYWVKFDPGEVLEDLVKRAAVREREHWERKIRRKKRGRHA